MKERKEKNGKVKMKLYGCTGGTDKYRNVNNTCNILCIQRGEIKRIADSYSSRNQSGADVANLQEAADVVFVV